MNIIFGIRYFFLISFTGLIIAGCASDGAIRAANWAAATTDSVKDKAEKYKEQRDALSKSRQLSINAVEAETALLQVETRNVTAFWDFGKKSTERSLFDSVISESESMAKILADIEAMQADHQKQVQQAKSSVTSVGEKLGEASKLFAELGAETDTKDQISFYVSFFTEVNKTMKANDDAGKSKEQKAVEMDSSGLNQRRIVIDSVQNNHLIGR